MLDFLDYLQEFEQEDVSNTKKIIKERWDKTIAVIKEAFGEKYTNKSYALHKIQNEFVKKTPESVDVEFLKENMNYIVGKVEELSEGDIKIIINNDVDKGRRSPASAPVEPVVVTGPATDGIDLEMEACGKTAKKKGRGRPKKKAVDPEEPAVEENVEEETEETEEVVEEETVEENKPPVDESKEENNSNENIQKEDNIMKKENTITWEDIEGDFRENIKEDVEEENVEEETEEVVEEEEEIETAPEDETPVDEVPEESPEEEAAEEDEEKEEEVEEGDKVTIEGEDEDTKYLVLSVDEDEQTINVEDPDGEELTFDLDQIAELEKSEENLKDDEDEVEEDEEGAMEADEGEDEEEVAEEGYDPEGDSIHDDIISARKILFGEAGWKAKPASPSKGQPDSLPKTSSNKSEGEPKMTGWEAKAGGTISKHNMPQAEGMPKGPASEVNKSGNSISKHNMPQAEGEPKTTGADAKDMKKKEKTASGYTQSPQTHNMPQAEGMPKDGKTPSNAALSYTPQPGEGMPKAPSMPAGGASISQVNHPQAEGMPKQPATLLDHYVAAANRFMPDDEEVLQEGKKKKAVVKKKKVKKDKEDEKKKKKEEEKKAKEEEKKAKEKEEKDKAKKEKKEKKDKK